MKKEDLLISPEVQGCSDVEVENVSTVEEQSQMADSTDVEDVSEIVEGTSEGTMPKTLDGDTVAITPMELLNARKKKVGNSVLAVLKARKSGKESTMSVKEVLASRRHGATSTMSVKELLMQRKYSKTRGVKVL